MTSRPFSILRVCLALACIGWSAPARAQSPLTVSALKIELWPEFDRPAVLVILTGTLDASVSLPATVPVSLPASSGGPYAVAVEDAQGQLVDAPYTTTPSGEELIVNLQADARTFHVEYYDATLDTSSETRAYTFRWTPSFAVTAATLQVQEPVEASNLSAEPALTPAGAGTFGLNYYSTSLGQLTAGQTVTLDLRYTKSSATLSSEVVSAQTPTDLEVPLAADSAQSAGGFAWPDIPPIVIGPILGLIAAGVVLLVLAIRQGRSGQRLRARARHGRRARHAAKEADGAEATQFCPQCGRRVEPGDRFCRNCGTALHD